MGTIPFRPHPQEYPGRHVPWSRPRHHASHGFLAVVGEVGLVVGTVFLYFLGRGTVDSEIAIARDHTRLLVRFERWLGIFYEPDLQQWVLKHDWLVSFWDGVYIYGHWPVLIATLIWLLWKRHDQLAAYRWALIFSGAVGLVVFALFPVAPPRMFSDLGFTDTVTIHSAAYRLLQPPAFTNQYAAMPSLHVGWNLLMGIAIYRNTTHRFWHMFAVLMPLAMYPATIFTANHLILDGIVGSLLSVASLVVATRWTAWLVRRRVQRIE